MGIEAEVRKLIDALVDHDISTIEVGGSPIVVRIFPEASRLSLVTSVYQGGGYLTPSVREAIGEAPPPSPLTTGLMLDEERCEIFLRYIGALDDLSQKQFTELIDEFHSVASQWRDLFDDNDRKDHVHVHVNR